MSRPTRRIRHLKTLIAEAERAWDEARKVTEEAQRLEDQKIQALRHLRDLLDKERGGV